MASEVTVGDAYARGAADGLVWTIGTKSVQMTFDGRGGMFRLVSFLKMATPSETVSFTQLGAFCTSHWSAATAYFLYFLLVIHADLLRGSIPSGKFWWCA